MPLYFAYGANMDAAAMAARCPRSRALSTARIARWRFIITADGYASVVPDNRAMVHGVLWDIALGDMAALDRYEDVARGLYRKSQISALRAPHGSVRALIYLARATEPGPPRPGYLPAVVAAARDWSLPPSYIAYLESLAPDPRKERRP